MEIKQFRQNNIDFITVRNRDFFEVTFSSLGASVYSIKHHFNYLSLTPSNIKDFLRDDIYHGKTIGRVAGRIKRGIVNINNRSYFIAQNENETALHGGYFGLSTRIFNSVINQEVDKVIITYSYISYDLESGFKGTVKLDVIYTVYEKENTLLVEFRAKSDGDTVLNLTNHLYFSLGENNLDNLVLKMNASSYIYGDDKTLIPREVREVNEDKFDFRQGRKISEFVNDEELVKVRAKGYDHQFLIDKENDHLLTLEGPRYVLDMSSSYDTCLLYSDNYENGASYFNTEQTTHRAVALEPQLNQLSSISLIAYETYYHYIKYTFKRK